MITPRIFWIACAGPGRLAILSRPASSWLADEISAWLDAGIDTVVSLLETNEVADLELRSEAELCQAAGIDFMSFPIADRCAPTSRQDALRLAEQLAARVVGGVAWACIVARASGARV